MLASTDAHAPLPTQNAAPTQATLVDSHCHLDYLHRRGLPVSEVLTRAQNAGISHVLSVATELKHDPLLASFCQQQDNVFRSIGVHPCHVQHEPEVTCADLLAMVDDPKVVAVGESGLDYFHDTTHKTLQHQLFRAHLSVAQQTNLPIIIHTRAADEDTLRIMYEAYAEKPFRGVFHCYIGSPEILHAAKEMDFYISLTGILTYNKSQTLRDIVPQTPINRLMVETDAPYLSPVPYRSKPCEPWMVRHTAECLAEILDMPFAKLCAVTTQNFFRLFNRACP